MGHPDYVVHHDFKTESHEELTRKIIYSLIIRRIKNKFPTLIGIFGASGHGKSYATLKLQQILLELQGIDFITNINNMNVYIPIQYSEKLDRIINDKELKKLNILAVHESRTLISSKDWQSFTNRTIADVYNMQRAVKRIVTMLVSQYVKDISKDIRNSLTYYFECKRPNMSGGKTKLYMYRIYQDSRDLENPRIKKARIWGFIVDPKGRYRAHKPSYIELNKPPKEACKLFDEQDYLSKHKIIQRKLKELMDNFKAKLGEESDKIPEMIKFYGNKPENLSLIGKRVRGKWKLNKQFIMMHDLKRDEIKEFELKLDEKLQNMGIAETDSN